MSVIVEFRLIKSYSSAADVYLYRHQMPTPPDRGEVINVCGDPYIAVDRAWAVDLEQPEMTYCYVRLSPHHAQAIEARSDETEGLGPQGESAVGETDAP